MKELKKYSPLQGVYEKLNAPLSEVNGWMMPTYINDREKEALALTNHCVLCDWSHIGKLTISGKAADKSIQLIFPEAKKLQSEKAWSDDKTVVLKHLNNSYTVLCQSGNEDELLSEFEKLGCGVINQTGGIACLVLAGKNRDEVMLRSSAMNLRRDKYPPGAVIQTTIHTITSTIYRTEDKELILCSRPYCESLYNGFQDVGSGQGLILAGLETLPVSFHSKEAA